MNLPNTGGEHGADCPSKRRHGTVTAYNTDGCRCCTARRAHARDAKRRRLELIDGTGPRLVDSAGTSRRLRALMAIGWPKAELARRLGVSTTRIDRLLADSTVRRSTRSRVQAVYAALADVPGPSAYTAGHARGRGYVPPIGWDDDIDNPAARPWAVIDDNGNRIHRAWPCARPGCRGWAVARGRLPAGQRRPRHCSDRCALTDQRGGRGVRAAVDTTCAQRGGGS